MKCIGHLKGVPLFQFSGLSGNISYSFKHTKITPLYGKEYIWEDINWPQYNNIIRNPKWIPVK